MPKQSRKNSREVPNSKQVGGNTNNYPQTSIQLPGREETKDVGYQGKSYVNYLTELKLEKELKSDGDYKDKIPEKTLLDEEISKTIPGINNLIRLDKLAGSGGNVTQEQKNAIMTLSYYKQKFNARDAYGIASGLAEFNLKQREEMIAKHIFGSLEGSKAQFNNYATQPLASAIGETTDAS